MAKISAKGLLVVALILSLAASFLLYNYLKSLADPTAKQGVSVVFAKVDIPPKTKITPEMIEERIVPEQYLQPGVVSGAGSIVGATVREQVIAGEPITERRLVTEGKTAGFSGLIPGNRRAISIAVTEVTGVAGFVKAGDFVDVVVTFDQNTAGRNASQIVLQNIQVLAANRDTESGATNEAAKEKKDVIKTSTVTLAVTPEEAVRVTLAEEKGKIRLALRSYTPGDGIVATNVLTPQDLIGAAPVTSTAPAAPAPKSSGGTRGIQVIRGTKTDVAPVN